MDEFHYYSDPERGVAWQIPLITLPRTRFLLMSATLGDVSAIAEHIQRATRASRSRSSAPSSGRCRSTSNTARRRSTRRSRCSSPPARRRSTSSTSPSASAPSSPRRSPACRSANREERERIREAVGDFRFDTPYGKECKRFLSFGIGVHHAGLLPKYRLLVEQLSQQGLLRVICGTDTLGVGVNIPIRTVLFTKLAKFDGVKTSILSVRDFKQIAGRAGRKGFDTQGSVVAQAPEHIIEKRKKRAERQQERSCKGPAKGEVSWNKETFEKLIDAAAGDAQVSLPHHPRHGAQPPPARRRAGRSEPPQLRLAARPHPPQPRGGGVQGAPALASGGAGALALPRRHHRDEARRVHGYLWAVVAEDLQWDFSLHQALSLYLVETIPQIEPESETYVPDLITLVESILENPDIVLRKQVDKLKGELVAQLKAEGVEYEERMEKLEEVTHPKPLVGLHLRHLQPLPRQAPLGGRRGHQAEVDRPRDVRGVHELRGLREALRLQRSEGVLLRYLSQLYKTLDQTVPEMSKTEGVWDALGFFRALVETTDSSLLEEWQGLLHPEILLQTEGAQDRPRDPLAGRSSSPIPRPSPPACAPRCTSSSAPSRSRSWDEAPNLVKHDPDDPQTLWDPERFESTMAPFFAEYGELPFTPESRRHHWTQIKKTGEREWEVTQTLLDPQGDNLWAVQGTIDLRNPDEADGPIVRVGRIGA